MQIWPAIDLRDGKCVRLIQGDYDREMVFGEDPVAMARHWVDEGAECLHLVDLEGARDGRPANMVSIEAILNAVDVPCRLGGGIRDEEAIECLLEIGLAQLVLGTAALKRGDWFREMCDKYPHRLALGIDARDGMVATDGWLETSSMAATELAAHFAEAPLAAIVYTDIARDGMLIGPNVAAMQQMQAAVDLPVIASGGVTTRRDVAQLAAIPMAGCIIGRSLYEGKLTLADALSEAKAAA